MHSESNELQYQIFCDKCLESKTGSEPVRGQSQVRLPWGGNTQNIYIYMGGGSRRNGKPLKQPGGEARAGGPHSRHQLTGLLRPERKAKYSLTHQTGRSQQTNLPQYKNYVNTQEPRKQKKGSNLGLEPGLCKQTLTRLDLSPKEAVPTQALSVAAVPGLLSLVHIFKAK